MKMNRMGAIKRVFEANPVGIAACLIIGRIYRGIINSLMARSLHAPGLHLGPDCQVFGGRSICFGRGVFAHSHLWLEAVTSYQSQRFNPRITIGNYVSFSDRVHITSITSIVIGDHVLMGSGVFISDHNHGIYKGEGQSRPEEPPSQRQLGGGGPVSIGDNVWIGDNVVILGPASIGSGAIIGANSVVRGIVPPNSMVAGAPARLVKAFDAEMGTWNRP